jgi:hypothetical protein
LFGVECRDARLVDLSEGGALIVGLADIRPGTRDTLVLDRQGYPHRLHRARPWIGARCT